MITMSNEAVTASPMISQPTRITFDDRNIGGRVAISAVHNKHRAAVINM
jgi:hypothetical protein